MSEKAALERAGFEGRDITIDFAKIGAKMSAVNSIVAFFNARLQGYAKLYESFRDQPMTTSARIFSYIVRFSAVARSAFAASLNTLSNSPFLPLPKKLYIKPAKS